MKNLRNPVPSIHSLKYYFNDTSCQYLVSLQKEIKGSSIHVALTTGRVTMDVNGQQVPISVAPTVMFGKNKLLVPIHQVAKTLKAQLEPKPFQRKDRISIEL